jgi:hypothetical protein
MIDKCDNEIACWSDAGDNFVVKNVEKFASVRRSRNGTVLVRDLMDLTTRFVLCTCTSGRVAAILQTLELFKLCAPIEFLWLS